MFVTSYDNTSIYYEVTGIGSALLLLHGFSNDHTIWERTGLVEKLKKDYTVITMDFRGCGLSDKPKSHQFYSIKANIQDINAVLKTCDKGIPIIWGWSFGATIALHFSKGTHVEATIAAGTYFGPIFTEEYINKRLKETADELTKIRLIGLRQWLPIYPDEIENPFLVYTGTRDGNVVVQIRKQKDKIIDAGGKVEILEDTDHYGLINNSANIDKYIMPFVRENSK